MADEFDVISLIISIIAFAFSLLDLYMSKFRKAILLVEKPTTYTIDLAKQIEDDDKGTEQTRPVYIILIPILIYNRGHKPGYVKGAKFILKSENTQVLECRCRIRLVDNAFLYSKKNQIQPTFPFLVEGETSKLVVLGLYPPKKMELMPDIYYQADFQIITQYDKTFQWAFKTPNEKLFQWTFRVKFEKSGIDKAELKPNIIPEACNYSIQEIEKEWIKKSAGKPLEIPPKEYFEPYRSE